MHTEFKYEHKGIKFNVELLPNAMIDANGRKLYKIEIEDWCPYNERTYDKRHAIFKAKQSIDSEL